LIGVLGGGQSVLWAQETGHFRARHAQDKEGSAGVFEAGGDAVDAFEDGVEEAGLVGGF